MDQEWFVLDSVAEPSNQTFRCKQCCGAGAGLFCWSRWKGAGSGSGRLLCDLRVLRWQSRGNYYNFSQIITIVTQIERKNKYTFRKVQLSRTEKKAKKHTRKQKLSNTKKTTWEKRWPGLSCRNRCCRVWVWRGAHWSAPWWSSSCWQWAAPPAPWLAAAGTGPSSAAPTSPGSGPRWIQQFQLGKGSCMVTGQFVENKYRYTFLLLQIFWSWNQILTMVPEPPIFEIFG